MTSEVIGNLCKMIIRSMKQEECLDSDSRFEHWYVEKQIGFTAGLIAASAIIFEDEARKALE